MTESIVCSPDLVRDHERRITKVEQASDDIGKCLVPLTSRVSVLEASQVVNDRRFNEGDVRSSNLRSSLERMVDKMNARDLEHDRKINALAIKVASLIGLLQAAIYFLDRLLR